MYEQHQFYEIQSIHINNIRIHSEKNLAPIHAILDYPNQSALNIDHQHVNRIQAQAQAQVLKHKHIHIHTLL